MADLKTPNQSRLILTVASKEMLLFFSSPIGYLFLLSFLVSILFTFFWIEAFFARNIADARPLFEWLPILLIFLSSALTMRMWSEEKRAGTIEFVMTLPVSAWHFVFGKFIACQALLVLALLMTLPLPITVSVMSNLDWGPVISGYIAAMLMGSTYIAIGLYFSARTDNQIVALILATFACGVFYAIGSPFFTGLFDHQLADVLRKIGTGSRFESITRGLLDVRDLIYYLTLTGTFLLLNVYALRSNFWAESSGSGNKRKVQLASLLLGLNIIVVNFWISSLSSLRWDLTEGDQYSLSDGTKSWLGRLSEPLLIRGYFSAKTHPLLAPLVPQLADLLKEYELASKGKARLEWIDPAQNPELENEANSRYGIRPVPFQISDRYQSGVVNSYFDILLQYGDEYTTLGFRELIEVKARAESQVDVRLRNPEFDITRAIKKAVQGYRSGNNVFSNLNKTVQFKAYISPDDRLPSPLRKARPELAALLAEFQQDAAGKFEYQVLDPEAGDGSLAVQIESDYGFSPTKANLADQKGFYFHLIMSDGDVTIQLPISQLLGDDGLRTAVENGLKRFASGLRQSVAIQTPEVLTENPYQPGQPPINSEYQTLTGLLTNDFEVEQIAQPTPALPNPNTGVLVVVDPKNMTNNEVFALDQFLMRGGTLIIATGAFEILLGPQIFASVPKRTGLESWLSHQGVTIDKSFVMDMKNAKFPVPVRRQVGPFTFQEIKMLDYPFFADLRNNQLNPELKPISTLEQLTLPWGSPVELNDEANNARKVTTLLKSSPNSWRNTSTLISPPSDAGGVNNFLPDGQLLENTLAVMIEGRFSSFFDAPPQPEPETDADDPENSENPEEEPEVETPSFRSLIRHSPDSARLIVIGSGAFLSDQVMRSVGSANGTLYTKPAQLIVNLVDWSNEDLDLLSIRNRGHFNRTLPPIPENEQKTWEYINYGWAALAVLLTLIVNLYLRKQRRRVGWLYEGQR